MHLRRCLGRGVTQTNIKSARAVAQPVKLSNYICLAIIEVLDRCCSHTIARPLLDSRQSANVSGRED